MERAQLRVLLEQISSGQCGIDAALEEMAHMPYSDLNSARFDHHRALRCGFAEVVFAPGKLASDIIRIVKDGLRSSPSILTTRLDESQTAALLKAFPDARKNPRARTVLVGQPAAQNTDSLISVVTAGTSDIPVAEEALETLRAFGCAANSFYDVGVAGLHRVLGVLPELRKASAIICVAGMEGALPSVVGGLVACPVIAVPTSVGYGASFGGVTALMSMLNTCAAGVSVVNIDNGFGAAMCALRIIASQRSDLGSRAKVEAVTRRNGASTNGRHQEKNRGHKR